MSVSGVRGGGGGVQSAPLENCNVNSRSWPRGCFADKDSPAIVRNIIIDFA